ncbi:uncharacterized protein LOC141898613 isoform X2 [Tubulanus polymorphus]|uniref:uncharacterized protein LOC141898613 isoform X2 n=1 Tax=Tubulanus polymorphus TaxID=672921 RepID=UPI003DA4E9BF
MLYPDNYSDIDSGVGSCSPTSTEPGSFVPEQRSVQPFKSTEEYLYAMKEDLAEWLNCLYNQDVDVDNFFEKLETGVLLCEHANNVQTNAEEYRADCGEDFHNSWNADPAAGLTYRSKQLRNKLKIPDKPPVFRRGVKAKSFQSRDNIANYISWCRELGIPDVLLFETEDLVNRKNDKNVILCLLEVARKGSKFGMLVPCLIQMEEEIDAEIRGEEPPKPKVTMPEVFVQQKTCDMKSLDEMVRDLAAQCNCPVQFAIIRVSEGKYMVGENRTLIFVRILRNHVMVRVGGGWDTLENYLNKHDSCRASGHRPSAAMTQKRRESNKNVVNQLNNNEFVRQPSPAKMSAKTTTQSDVSTDEAYSSESQVSSPRRRASCPTRNEDTKLVNGNDFHSPRSNRPADLVGVKSQFRTIDNEKAENSEPTVAAPANRFGFRPGSARATEPKSSESVRQSRPSTARSASATRAGRQSPAPSNDGQSSNRTRPQSAKKSGRQSPAPFSTPQPSRRQLPAAPAGSKTPTGPLQSKCLSASSSPSTPRKQRSASTTQMNIHGSFETIRQQTDAAQKRLRSSTTSLAERTTRAKTPTSDATRRRMSEDRPRAKTPQPGVGGSLQLSKSAQIMKQWKTKDDTITVPPNMNRQRRNSASDSSSKVRPKSETRRSSALSLENIPSAVSLAPPLDDVEDLGGNAAMYREMERMFQEYKEQETARAAVEDELNQRILDKIKPAVEKYRQQKKEQQQQQQRKTNSTVPRKMSSPSIPTNTRAKTPTRDRSSSLVSSPSGLESFYRRMDKTRKLSPNSNTATKMSYTSDDTKALHRQQQQHRIPKL